MNFRIFQLINNLALKHRLLDNVMIFSSKYLPYLMALTICAVFIFGVLKHEDSFRQSAISTALLVAANLMINFLIGCFIYVPRPFVSHKVDLLYPHIRDSSFPSDHATVTMSTAVGLARAKRMLGYIFTALSILVGFSRIYVGHHYPFDIIGSFLIAFSTRCLYHKLFEKKVDILYSNAERRFLIIYKSIFCHD